MTYEKKHELATQKTTYSSISDEVPTMHLTQRLMAVTFTISLWASSRGGSSRR